MLVVLVLALALSAAYLILSHWANSARPSSNATSPQREKAATTGPGFNEPKALTAVEYYEQGLALTKSRKYEDAAEAYRQAISQDPNMALAHHELGYAYTQVRQWNKAVASLKEATALKPDSPDSHRLLGDALAKLGRWEEAVKSYNQAITLEPNSAAAYFGLGTVYKNRRQLTDAVNAYVKVTELKPNNATAHYELGLLYLELGDSDAAETEYEILLSQNRQLAERLHAEMSRY